MNRYSDSDLQEFKVIVQNKLEIAKQELSNLKSSLAETEGITLKSIDDCSEAILKDELIIMASRQEKLITELNAAMSRIENKTYGVCRETGVLIPKERLKIVPHATLSIEAKNKR